MPRAMTIGEELVGAWLTICGGCEFVTYSQRHPAGQGEIGCARRIRQLETEAKRTTKESGNSAFRVLQILARLAPPDDQA